MLNCKSVPRPPFLLKNCYFGVLDYVFNNILTFLTENPLLKTDFKIAEITNGANDTVPDVCGYIEIKKNELKSVTYEPFKDFVSNRVKNSGYSWVSIICDDGTGLNFRRSVADYADYGKMDKQGRINEAIGIVMFDTDDYFYYESNSN